MPEKKFAFESGKIALALIFPLGLGDCVVARKVFNALVELSPNCIIDTFCLSDKHKVFANAFIGDSNNLNLILLREELTAEILPKYDLCLRIEGTSMILPDSGNVERLQALSSALFESLVKIDAYNKQNIYSFGSSFLSCSLRNHVISRILRKKYIYFLSCGGALPLQEEGAYIPLSKKYANEWKKLKLNRYITIYSDIESDTEQPKTKTWPIQYLREYVSLMKRKFPRLKIVQVGGGRGILR